MLSFPVETLARLRGNPERSGLRIAFKTMTWTDIFDATKWRCYLVLRKLIRNKCSQRSNRVTPIRSRRKSPDGTVDASEEITLQTFLSCPARFPPPPEDPSARAVSIYENVNRTYDSAYDTMSSGVSMLVSFDNFDSCQDDVYSVTTEVTCLEYDFDESEQLQNIWNETVETIVSSR